MNALPPLPNLADLLAALLPAQAPATPQRVAGEPPAETSFEAVLLDAQAQPPAALPAELLEIEEREAEPEAADPLPQSALEIPAIDVAPVEAEESPSEPAPAVDPAPLLLGPSLVNLVLGTAAGLREAPRAEPAAPEHRAQPTPPSPASERDPALGTSDFPPLEVAKPPRESDPRSAPRHDATPDPAPARPVEADAQTAPAREPAPLADPQAQRAAQADAALRAAQGNVAAANTAPAVSDPGPARASTAASNAARALPELPARGEVEVVRSVRVLADQGGGRVHIRLDPPELGGLSLRVVVSDGVVHVSMLADQAPVADLLQRHSSELRSALESHGLRLDQLDVGTGQSDLGSRDAHPREAEERAATGARGPARRFDPIALPQRRYDVSTLGAVDLHV